MKNNIYGILYGIDLDVQELKTKSGKNYLRMREPQLNPKSIAKTLGENKRYTATREGVSSVLAFQNKNSSVLTTWNYIIYKPVGKIKKGCQFTKNAYVSEWQKKWEKSDWRVKWKPGRETLIFKKNKKGEVKILFSHRYRKGGRKYRYLKTDSAIQIIHNMLNGAINPTIDIYDLKLTEIRNKLAFNSAIVMHKYCLENLK